MSTPRNAMRMSGASCRRIAQVHDRALDDQHSSVAEIEDTRAHIVKRQAAQIDRQADRREQARRSRRRLDDGRAPGGGGHRAGDDQQCRQRRAPAFSAPAEPEESRRVRLRFGFFAPHGVGLKRDRRQTMARPGAGGVRRCDRSALSLDDRRVVDRARARGDHHSSPQPTQRNRRRFRRECRAEYGMSKRRSCIRSTWRIRPAPAGLRTPWHLVAFMVKAALSDAAVRFGERSSATQGLHLLRFENVGLRYGMGVEVVRDLNFDIAPQSFQFLTGPSGAGKTTLLRLMLLSLQARRAASSRIFGRTPRRSTRTPSPA